MVPILNAQRCKKYRDKNKENYKKNDAFHKKHYRLMMKLNDSEKYKEKKEKDTLRKRAEREQKKLGAGGTTNTFNLSSNSNS